MLSEIRKQLEIKHGLRLVGHDKGSGLGAYTQAEVRRAEEERHTEAVEKGVPGTAVKLAEPETVQLERRVRAAASVAVDEADFLHHLHEQDVVVRPRFATGDRATVVGMSVALPTDGGGQSLIWHGGGRLAKDLTLPALRKHWDQTTEAQAAAVPVWHQLGVGGTTKTDTADRAVPAAAERTQTPVGEPTPADLQSRVRTAAEAATGEAQFLEQLHAQGVVVRPRFATGDSTTVVGMSVALPTGDTGNDLDWHGAGKLGKDLSLPALRERWGQGPEQQAAAVEVWRQLGAVGKHSTGGAAAGGHGKAGGEPQPGFRCRDRGHQRPRGVRRRTGWRRPGGGAGSRPASRGGACGGGVAGPRPLGWGHRVGGAADGPLRPRPAQRPGAAGGDPREGGPADESDECGAAGRRHRQSAARRVGRGVPRPGPHHPSGGRGATQFPTPRRGKPTRPPRRRSGSWPTPGGWTRP